MVFRERMADGTTRLSGGIVSSPVDPEGPGDSMVAEFSFATAMTTWTMLHNFGYSQVSVVTFDPSGAEIQGDVRYLDSLTAEVTWYYPTAGTALVQR